MEFNKNLEEKTQQFDDEMAKYNDKNYIFNYDTSDRNESKNNSSKRNKISINVENIDTNKNESETMSENEDEEEILLNISFIYDVEKGKKYNLVQLSGSWDNWKEKAELKYDPLNNRWKITNIYSEFFACF